MCLEYEKNVASTWSKKANASKNCVTEGIDINCSRFIWLWHDSNCILFDSLIQLRMLCKRVKNSLKTCSYPLSSVRYGIEIVIKEVRHFFFRHKSHKMNRQNVITAFNKKKKEKQVWLDCVCVCMDFLKKFEGVFVSWVDSHELMNEFDSWCVFQMIFQRIFFHRSRTVWKLPRSKYVYHTQTVPRSKQ